MRYAEDITTLIGKTPLVRINRLVSGDNTVLAKLEMFNPLSSVKDRIGLAMIEAAEKTGRLKQGDIIVEPTSGNTGIALAFVCALRGYHLIITMPESMSIERQRILKNFGAELILTPASEGIPGAMARARKISIKRKAFMPLQFENPANPQAHYDTTGQEIWGDTDGKVDIFISGIGTGGTISGIGRALKEKNSSVEIIGLEPEESAVLSGGKPGKHEIQGIGAGFIPKTLDMSVIDRIIRIKSGEALAMSKRLAKEEGIFAGISSGAAMSAACRVDREVKQKIITVILPDTGERYLS